jgi:hypothetical protein
MGKKYEGRSDAAADPDAGFRAAAKNAVDNYRKENPPQPGAPERLSVREMYVEVQNPIHGYIVVLETTP